MPVDAIFVAVVAVLSLVLLMSGRVSLDLVGIGLILVLVVGGVITMDEALDGFANHAVITLAGLYVIGEGLAFTGALNFIAHYLLRISGGSELKLTLGLCFLSAFMSGIASNTAVVLVFIPLSVELARRLKIGISRLLLPMAFSSILGGTLTLVGSTTNLLTSGSAEAAGASPLGLFTMTPIALVLCVVGVPMVLLMTKYFLPERRSLTASLAATPMREFVTELHVGPASPLIGSNVAESFQADDTKALMVVREEIILWPPFDDVVVRENDTLLLRGKINRLLELQNSMGLELLGDTRFDPRSMKLFELVLAPSSSLIGIRLGKLHLWRDFGVLTVAVLRGGHHYKDLASNMHLRPGDVLLVCGPEESEARIERSQDFYRIAGVGDEDARLEKHAKRALWITLAVVALFVLGTIPVFKEVLPIPLVVLAGAIMMVATRCINTRRAYRCIGWPILLFVVGALSLGAAMQATGLSDQMAHGIVGAMASFGTAGVLSGLLLAGTVLNQFVSPYAVSVLLTPIALSMAHSQGIEDPLPFLLAVAFAGSNAFATPLGHQVNLLVLGPGGYRYSDYLRVGVPLCIFYWIACSIGLSFYV
ncbi:MAG: SLC13 family permease [Planctomycetota bacterium]|nr:SLC13 family permease [Planctomycetota bacterium]MDG2142503.1 SLC13 family permease [Planctomycetota bacterium]